MADQSWSASIHWSRRTHQRIAELNTMREPMALMAQAAYTASSVADFRWQLRAQYTAPSDLAGQTVAVPAPVVMAAPAPTPFTLAVTKSSTGGFKKKPLKRLIRAARFDPQALATALSQMPAPQVQVSVEQPVAPRHVRVKKNEDGSIEVERE